MELILLFFRYQPGWGGCSLANENAPPGNVFKSVILLNTDSRTADGAIRSVVESLAQDFNPPRGRFKSCVLESAVSVQRPGGGGVHAYLIT